MRPHVSSAGKRGSGTQRCLEEGGRVVCARKQGGMEARGAEGSWQRDVRERCGSKAWKHETGEQISGGWGSGEQRKLYCAGGNTAREV